MVKKLTERQLWAVLLHADVMSEVANDLGNGKLSLQYTSVGNLARKELRNRFDLNLDEICLEAQEQADLLLAEEQDKERREKEHFETLAQVRAKAESLLKKHE